MKDSSFKINIADGVQIANAWFNGDSRILLELMLTADREYDDCKPPLLP